MLHRKRRKLFIDRNVQGTLAFRVVAYWALCLWGVFFVLAFFPIAVTGWFQFANGPTASELIYQTWIDFWPSVAASMLLLPVLIWDVMRLSNRFAGPVYRMRNAMRALADGKPVRPIRFREDDFWYDFAEEFNRVAAMAAGDSANTPDDAALDPAPRPFDPQELEADQELEEVNS